MAEAFADSTNPDIIHNNVSIIQREAKLVPMVLDKRLAKRPLIATILCLCLLFAGLDDHERRLGAAISAIEILLKDNLGVVEALVLERRARLFLELVHLGLQLGNDPAAVLPHGRVRLLALVDDVREGHAVGGQHGRVAVDEDLGDAEGLGDGDGVLAAGAAKGREAVLGRVVALGLGDGPDGARHGFVCDGEEAEGDFVCGQVLARLLVDLVGEFLQHLSAGVHVEALVLVFAKDFGEELGQETAQVQVGVRDGRRAALSVAGRARVSAGGFGPDDEQAVAEEEARAAAGSDGVDVELGRLDGDAGGGGFKDVLVPAFSVTRYVCAGASLLNSFVVVSVKRVLEKKNEAAKLI